MINIKVDFDENGKRIGGSIDGDDEAEVCEALYYLEHGEYKDENNNHEA